MAHCHFSDRRITADGYISRSRDSFTFNDEKNEYTDRRKKHDRRVNNETMADKDRLENNQSLVRFRSIHPVGKKMVNRLKNAFFNLLKKSSTNGSALVHGLILSTFILSSSSYAYSLVYNTGSYYCFPDVDTRGTTLGTHWIPDPRGIGYETQYQQVYLISSHGSFCRSFYTQVASCSPGYTADSNGVCMANTCTDAGGSANYLQNTCVLPPLSTYDNNPSACIKANGYPRSFIEGNGGNIFKGTLRFKMVSKCETVTETAESTTALVASTAPLGTSGILGVWAKKAFDKLKAWKDALVSASNPKAQTDIYIGLPKIKTDGTIDAEIIETPVSKSDGVNPDRAGSFDIDGYNAYLRDVYFPAHPDQVVHPDPVIDQAKLDRFNIDNKIFKDNGTDPVTYTYKTETKPNLWTSTVRPTSSTDPLYDTLQMEPTYTPKPTYTSTNFNVVPPTAPAPPPAVIYGNTPVTHTVTSGLEGTLPVKIFTNTRTYSDGSSSQEVIKLSEAYKTGTRSVTTMSADGQTSTTSETFTVPNYSPSTSANPEAWDVIKTSPVANYPLPINLGTPTAPAPIDPSTGYPTTTTEPLPLPTESAPTTATGVDLINAPMPSYSFPSLSDFNPFSIEGLSSTMEAFGDMFSNMYDQLTSIGTTFDETKAMLQNGFETPTIRNAQCGTSMQFAWHGQTIDLCPPMTDFLSKFYALFSLLVTISGTVLAIRIYLGAMKD